MSIRMKKHTPFTVTADWLRRIKGREFHCSYCSLPTVLGDVILPYSKNKVVHYPECYDKVFYDLPDDEDDAPFFKDEYEEEDTINVMHD